MKFITLILAFAANCIPIPITGSLNFFKDNICDKEDQLSIGTADLALNKKVYLKDSGVAFPIQSLKWQYPGPFKLSFYDGKAEQPYAIVTGPKESTYVSNICSGFKTNGLGGSFLKVALLDTSRVKPDSPIFVSPESYFIAESLTPAPSFSSHSSFIKLIYTNRLYILEHETDCQTCFSTKIYMQDSTATAGTGGKSSGDSLVFHFFSKTAQIILQSRLTESLGLGFNQHAGHLNKKCNKWFNIELEEINVLKEELKFWKGQLLSSAQAPPLIIDVLLDISNLKGTSQIVITNPKTGRNHRISHESLMGVDGATGKSLKKQKILLETWQLTLSPATTSLEGVDQQQLELPTVYKKCIIFFRSLYSYVRLMPSFKLCKQSASSKYTNQCKIVYRVGSSRVNSPLDAGLDQLHPSSDLRNAVNETDFPSVETPLGIFTLHAAYRVECNFMIDDIETEMEGLVDFEPRFSTQQQQMQQPLSFGSHKSSNFPSEVNPNYATSSSTIPHTKKERVYIPNSNWKDIIQQQNQNIYGGAFSATSVTGHSPSPDAMFFKTNVAGTTPSSIESRSTTSQFTPFTPPTSNPLTDRKLFLENNSKDAPPFSTAVPVNIMRNNIGPPINSLGSASPPFAIPQRIEEHLAASAARSILFAQRRPSYVFPSSPANATIMNPSQINTSGNAQSPLIFTPSSSFVHPPTLKANTPSLTNNLSEVENFLSVIEQAQNLRITSGQIDKKSSLKGLSKLTSSVMASNAVDRFRELQKENTEFAKEVDLQLAGILPNTDISNSSVYQQQEFNKNSQVHSNKILSDAEQHVTPKIDVPRGKNSFKTQESQNPAYSRRGRRKSLSADLFPSSSALGSREISSLVFAHGGLELARPESTKTQSQSEDDDLLFNMSDIHHH